MICAVAWKNTDERAKDIVSSVIGKLDKRDIIPVLCGGSECSGLVSLTALEIKALEKVVRKTKSASVDIKSLFIKKTDIILDSFLIEVK